MSTMTGPSRASGNPGGKRSGNLALPILAVLAATVATAADSGFVPPTSIFLHTDFDEPSAPPSIPHPWEIHAGSWTAAGGTYNSTSPTPTAITTIFEYVPNPNGPPNTGVSAPYVYRARMLNQRDGATNLVGIVYDYVDENNYSEAVFSPNNQVTLRRVSSGVTTVVDSSLYAGGHGVWFDVELVRGRGTTTLRVGGLDVVSLVAQTNLFGRVGLITHETTAKFDKVSLARPFGEQPFQENFTDGFTQPWLTTGQWSVADGAFNNTTVQATSSAALSSAGITLAAESTLAYTLRARMLNPYGASGNLVGLSFHDGPSGHAEVVFSPTGVAKINVIADGASHTIATAAYNGRRDVWFDVRLDVRPGIVSVTVDGVLLFDEVSTDPLFDGSIALVTHWAPGRFDDVWYDNRAIFEPLSQTFDTAPPPQWIVNGMWEAGGGTLNNTSADSTDIVATECACWETDFSYRARLLNQYGASGNLVGLVYNYQRLPFSPGNPKPYVGLYTGDYYEVVFAPTGQAFLNKVINGVRYRVGSSVHDVPRNAWFEVELLRQQVSTTVRVNGVTIFDQVPQNDLPFGDVGVVTHWAKGRFDDLSVTDAPRR